MKKLLLPLLVTTQFITAATNHTPRRLENLLQNRSEYIIITNPQGEHLGVYLPAYSRLNSEQFPSGQQYTVTNYGNVIIYLQPQLPLPQLDR